MVKKKKMITDLMKLMKKWKTSDFDDFNHVKKGIKHKIGKMFSVLSVFVIQGILL